MELKISTKGNSDIIDITEDVIKYIPPKTKSGLLHIFVIGSTAGITTIEDDNNLYEDFRNLMKRLIPMTDDWLHHKTWGDDNGGSHLRAAIIGPSLTVPIVDSKLILGTWQKIVLIDFDTRPRNRTVVLTIIS
jgi:secondary thiamine-phosphate synthase enzyme